MTSAITVREAEYSDRDRALLISDHAADTAPRGAHGVLLADATDPKNNPYSTGSTGRFVAHPYADFAQDAIDRARKERRELIGDDDWPMLWTVEHQAYGADEVT